MVSIFHNEDAVRSAITGSGSMKEAIEKLGLRSAGGNFKGLTAAAERFGLELPVYDRTSTSVTWGRSDEDIFCENSLATRACTKRAMLRNGFPNSCSGCGIGPEWNGKKLTLQLEHINGVYNDNRIENLTFLCPNCHSQTPTFSGKKSGSKRIHPICQICNLPKQNFYSGTHSACTPKRTKIDWPDNDELRKMVSENGYSKTGRLLGVSDNAVRKHLKNN